MKDKGQCEFGMLTLSRCADKATCKWGETWLCDKHGRRIKPKVEKEPYEKIQALLTKTANELIRANARIRELESLTTCAPGKIAQMPTPETDEAWERIGIIGKRGARHLREKAQMLEQSRDFLLARLIERTIAYERRDRELCEKLLKKKDRQG